MVMVRNYEKYFPLNNIENICKKLNEIRNKKQWQNLKCKKNLCDANRRKDSKISLKKLEIANFAKKKIISKTRFGSTE